MTYVELRNSHPDQVVVAEEGGESTSVSMAIFLWRSLPDPQPALLIPTMALQGLLWIEMRMGAPMRQSMPWHMHAM